MQSIETVPADKITFEEFCILLDKLQKKKKQNQEQDRILIKFINDFRLKLANISVQKNSSLFSVLRLLLPQRDRERNPYNLKEKRLGEVLVKVLSLPKQSLDALKLLNFRSVPNSQHDSDFAGVAYFVLRNRVAQKSSSLTIGDINGILDKIAPTESGNKSTLDAALSYAYKKLTAEQLKWFLRIILKDMKLGMSVHRILAAFHPDAPEFFDNCADLNKVCDEFADGDSRPSELGIQLFYAVSPMLSERLNITQVTKILENKTYVIEDKFDGERFQMHMENGVFEYFSRKGFKYADHFGKTYDSGLLTPHLKGCFSEDVTSIILDGEMMGWHKEKQYFGSKAMPYDIKKITENSSYRPCFCVYDILFYNGKSLVGPAEKGGFTLQERFKVLDTVFTDVLGVIQHSKRKPVQKSEDILDALNAAIENQDEGIVVKDVDSYYIANKRNAGWYKIKPEYTDSTMTDLDLVIIGADEAEDKRHGRAKNFYVACLDASGCAPRWVCVGRVGAAARGARAALCAALGARWAPRPPPPALRLPRPPPDLWVLPEHSVVLQIRATELVRNKESEAGYTLRFARITRVRDDKPVKDILTLQELQQLASSKGPVVKLSSKRVSADQISNADMKVPRKQRTIQVAEQFLTKAAGDVCVTSRALLGRKLCILSDDPDCTKAELIAIVESHSGKHVQNIGPDTWCSVAGKITEKVKHIQAQKVNIITTSWLRGLPKSDTLCALSPLDMLSMDLVTKLRLSLDYDRFGDNYTECIDEVTLKKCFAKMEKNEVPIYLMEWEMLQIDEILFNKDNPFSFLRGCNICVEKPLQASLARFYGAESSMAMDNITENITHVVIPKDTKPEDKEKIKRNTAAYVVSEEWLEACLTNKRMVSEIKYLL
ncbi:DNA ligase 4 [Epargyreus clarus]|uniref:DNA ligase 4 n=1 Tax=Epargyreus clarus TaxID=520877 RepID=UPI003C2F6BFF